MIFKYLTIQYPPLFADDIDYEIEEKIFNINPGVLTFRVGKEVLEVLKESPYYIRRGKYCSDGRTGTYDKRAVFLVDYLLPTVLVAEGPRDEMTFRVCK